MKKTMLALVLAAVAAGSFATPAEAGQVTFAPLSRSYAPPPLGRKEGWLTISNHDWRSYSLVIADKEKLFLYRDGGHYGGVIIPSGTTITLALKKDTWDLYGDNSDKLKVRIREGRTTTLLLEPFGFVGNSGLRGVVNDGDRVRDTILFDTYSTSIVVPTPPPVVVHPAAPPPPPPPPVVIHPRPRPPHRPPPPPPPPPPPRGHRPPPPGHRPPPPPKDDGFSFFFGVRRG